MKTTIKWITCLREHADDAILDILNTQPKPCIVKLKHLGIHNANDAWNCLMGIAAEKNQVRIPIKSFSILKRTAR